MILQPEKAGDVVLRAVQRQAQQQVIIEEVAGDTAGLWQQEAERLHHLPLTQVLGADIAERIREDVEYTPGGLDVVEILRKVRTPTIRLSHGGEQVVEWQLQSDLTHAQEVVVEIRFRPIRQMEARQSQRPLAKALGLLPPNVEQGPQFSQWIEKIGQIFSQLPPEAQQASLLLCQLEQPNEAIQQAVAQALRRNLRNEDRVGHLQPGQLGCLLLDVTVKDAEVVAGRLRVLLARESLRLPDGRTTHPHFTLALTPLAAHDQLVTALQRLYGR